MQLNESWQWIIALLSLFTLLSLSLNVVIIKKIVNSEKQLNMPSFELDMFPVFQAGQLHTNDFINTDVNSPTVLIFLATNCPKCKGKIKTLENLVLHSESQGVSLRIIVHEQMKGIASFFNHTQLTSIIWKLNYADYKVINPHEISPAYLFVNELSEIEGQGMIDDDNWQHFQQQILGESE